MDSEFLKNLSKNVKLPHIAFGALLLAQLVLILKGSMFVGGIGLVSLAFIYYLHSRVEK